VNRLSLYACLVLVAACGSAEDGPQEAELSANEVAEQLSALEIEPGLWESTTQIVSVSGPLPEEALKQMTGQRTSIRNCITPEQAKRPSANFLAAQQNSDCTYQQFKVENGRLNGRMTCSGGDLPDEMVTVMNGAYGPEGYDMVLDMETAALPGNLAMKIKARTEGRRVGECS